MGKNSAEYMRAYRARKRAERFGKGVNAYILTGPRMKITIEPGTDGSVLLDAPTLALISTLTGARVELQPRMPAPTDDGPPAVAVPTAKTQQAERDRLLRGINRSRD